VKPSDYNQKPGHMNIIEILSTNREMNRFYLVTFGKSAGVAGRAPLTELETASAIRA
jgi:hypothetical protein